ncbi:Ger(x)C family spore germination protein [Anaerobacillus sp. CMMVII]|uniref:Ger(x)C family spore germination protein n=1 Tax=Anaerobacillus sp. CMMVII TaxID=2755588 RepID=UPI0021B82A44|nr:Ger(x)C family spore germination protein [Anaerobacillus sp. CMMVII]MCT8136559.1 Ger(x)C family spore germination protein [Anaerobacillus sp. CMMVII]
MKRVRFLLVLFCCVLLSSCVDAREIDHRSMIVGMGLDLEQSDSEDQGKIKLTVQIPILLSGGGEGNISGAVKEFETFTATGETILDAVAEIEAMTPTVLFFGHLKVITIGDVLAKQGLDQVIDFFDRLPQVANQIFLLIIEDVTAEEFISFESPLVSLPALYLNRFFQADQKIARTKDVKLFEYRRDANMISGASTLPLARINGGKKIVIEGMGVFEDHKLVAKLTSQEVVINELLKNNKVHNSNFTTKVNVDGKEEQISISRGRLKVKIGYEKKDPLTINLQIKGKGEISEVGSIRVRVSNELVKQVGENLEEEITDLVRKTIRKMQEKNVEPWLLGHRLWAMDPKFFDSLDWEKTGWRESNINVSVDFEIVHTGQKSYLSKTKIGR